mgnify:CR=1 FL=1|tara:strand:- start:660 stop:881 length:222 start_codon:yes stop_codon:yes gene_type:complete
MIGRKKDDNEDEDEAENSLRATDLMSFRDSKMEQDEKELALTQTEHMHPDFFVGVYYSLITKHRDRYNVSKED